MDVSALSATANQESSSLAAQGKQDLTQQDFLNLFTAQLKFQNPLEPLDNYQMASQMAQFSTVDALAKMSESLDAFMANQSSMQNLQASNLIGKKVQAKGDHFTIDQGAVSEGFYQLAKPGNVMVQIYDASGTLVGKIEPGIKDASMQKIEWNGKDPYGFQLPDGVYTFRVVAADENGQAVPVTTYQISPITAAHFENGTTLFRCGSDLIPLNDITAILAS